MSKEIKNSTAVIVRKNNQFIKYIFWGMFAVIAVLSIIAWVKIRNLQEKNIRQKIEYEQKIDSVHIADMAIMAKTFSWAVRSDLLRNNKDQAQLHLDNLMKEPNLKKAFVIDAANNNIVLSTSKNEIGIPNSDFSLTRIETPTIRKNGDIVQIATPIMNLHKKMGVCVVEINGNIQIRR
ncbi:MAG: hypothetical protein ACK5L7_03895 [Paludibacteraceae bacterium]